LKCPKCGYLGFETGDTCKNCGYDFSLIAPAPILTPDPDLAIRSDDGQGDAPELWLDRLDRSMDEVSRPYAKQEHLIGVPEAKPTPQPDPLPLFNPDDPDDIPLIALPAAPRPPLSVRRNAEPPRLRAVPRSSSVPAASLDFHAEADAEAHPEQPAAAPAAQRAPTKSSSQIPAEPVFEVAGRRLIAALVDHAILLGVDAIVIYFTLRMAGLTQSEWLLLPLVPMAVFLGLLKLSYFSAFTAIGGQTIGKMATGIKVIAESGRIDSAVAIRRSLAAALSLLPLGIGFLPALVGSDRRALHDRLTGTRVVALRSA
jgi:uncharacterized RDD family membrane protein YckC